MLLNTFVGLEVTVQLLMQRHAMVMGSTWGMLIPLTILMARLRNKKGWWFQLHRALAVTSLVLVLVGAILGRRLRVTHPPVTIAGKLHKFLGHTAVTFISLQVGTCFWHLLSLYATFHLHYQCKHQGCKIKQFFSQSLRYGIMLCRHAMLFMQVSQHCLLLSHAPMVKVKIMHMQRSSRFAHVSCYAVLVCT